MQISHEAIYRSLFIETRGAPKKELLRSRELRGGCVSTKPQREEWTGTILDMVFIRERPAKIEDALCRGIGKETFYRSERNAHRYPCPAQYRFTMLINPPQETTTVVAALAKHISKLPEELRRSLTWDQGKEMHAHKRFTVATNVQVYFCDPRSPWQRGSNENTNGLLRQYLPERNRFLAHLSELS